MSAGTAPGLGPETDSAPGLYVHVPFCSSVCPYCDFAVLVGGEARRRSFVDLLRQEIRLAAEARLGPRPGPPPAGQAPSAAPARSPGWRPFDTIYFGGGTPSLLDPSDVERILAQWGEELPVAADPRIFLEANPEDVTEERLAAWRALGVRTLSLGVQSFDAAALEFLGRRHTPDDGRRSIELARAAGLPTVSVDLIYGLPGQELGDWRRDLETAIALAPDHLSCYELTVHRQTVFGVRRRRGELVELPEDRQAELFLFTHRFLGERGYPGYEVSNFAATPEHRSRHNRKYWDHTPYLGLGPSAHSFDGRRRWWNERQLGAWERRIARGERPIAGAEELTTAELALERLMLGLRTRAGVDLAELRERYGLDLRGTDTATVARLVESGLLVDDRRHLRPTLRGLAVADSLACAFRLAPAA